MASESVFGSRNHAVESTAVFKADEGTPSVKAALARPQLIGSDDEGVIPLVLGLFVQANLQHVERFHQALCGIAPPNEVIDAPLEHGKGFGQELFQVPRGSLVSLPQRRFAAFVRQDPAKVHQRSFGDCSACVLRIHLR